MHQNVVLYAYLDLNKPLTRWETAIGRIRTAGDRAEMFCISPWLYSRLKDYSSSKRQDWLRNELLLEVVRRESFPHCASRITGSFFFEEQKYVLPTLRKHFGWRDAEPSFVSEINFSATTLTKVDSNWITNYSRSKSGDITWMYRYWSGEVCDRRPAYELIGEGIGYIPSREVRKLAYERIMREAPLSTLQLSLAATAFFFAATNR